MPVFEYSAYDRSGRSKSGMVDADNRSAARRKLRDAGMFPVALAEGRDKGKSESARILSLLVFIKKVTPQEIHVFSRQLATLLAAGIPLVGALDALIEQTANFTFKRVLSQINESVKEGNSLTAALSRYPLVFSKIYINMVRSGEESGTLALVLERLADLGEKQDALAGRIKAAMIYPVFMAIVATSVLFFLMAFIVPNITRIFVEMQQALPWPTRVLIEVSSFVQSFWWAILLGVFIAVLVLRECRKRAWGRYYWDKLILRLPIFGRIQRKMALARFGRTLGSLLQNGVPLLASLQIVKNIVNNILIARVLEEAMDEVQAGKSLHATLAHSQWFPPMVVQMISVGEQSGELEGMLHKIADTYEREVEFHVMGMTALIEPVMILLMGLAVLFIVLAILLPLFDLNQMIF